MNVICISNGVRSEYLRQTLGSLQVNAFAPQQHTITLVVDGKPGYIDLIGADTLIVSPKAQGASASRNIGAGSIPKYRRKSHVMFTDDDVYFMPGWDKKLMELSARLPHSLVSGHAHPYNHAVKDDGYGIPLVISTVNFFMPWEMWDEVEYFSEPGGPGGSEDHEWCMRAKAKGYGFAVTDPHCVIHAGLTSSTGKRIVGYPEMVQQNEKLIAEYGLAGKVVWK